MKQHRTCTFASLLTMALLWSSTGCLVINGDDSEANYRETRTSMSPASTAIEVRSGNGGIVLHRAAPTDSTTAPSAGSPAQTIIVAKLAAKTAERLEAAQIVSELQTDGTLLISVAWPGGKHLGSESCSFDITVPGELRSIRCNSSNGGIHLTQLSGEAKVGTSNGQILIEDHVGAVRASTSNGRVAIKHVTGSVDARTSNGAIEISDVGGGVVAQTSNGRVNLAFGAASPGSLDVRTSNGPVDVTLPAGYAGRIDLSTSNGAIRFPGGPSVRSFSSSQNHAEFTIGEGSATSTVITSNGSIDLRIAP